MQLSGESGQILQTVGDLPPSTGRVPFIVANATSRAFPSLASRQNPRLIVSGEVANSSRVCSRVANSSQAGSSRQALPSQLAQA